MALAMSTLGFFDPKESTTNFTLFILNYVEVK